MTASATPDTFDRSAAVWLPTAKSIKHQGRRFGTFAGRPIDQSALRYALGISYEAMEAMIREKSVRAFSGVAFTLGRQAMAFSPSETLDMFQRLGVKPAITDEGQLGIDNTTRFALSQSKRMLIRDVDFFRMLGFQEVKAIDFSDLEGAEIITNLNDPIRDDLAESCDFLVDGSTLDNIFDPVTGLKNIGRLLRAGGRCLIINAGNFPTAETSIPYVVPSPLWYFDYFAINEFEACEVYCQIDYSTRASVYWLSHDHAARRWDSGQVKALHNLLGISIYVFAEKGLKSTWERVPTQHAYRAESEWGRFQDTVSRFKRNGRSPLIRPRSEDDAEKTGIPNGWYRVRPDGSLVEPAAYETANVVMQ